MVCCKTLKYTFSASLVGFVGAGRKMAWVLNIPEIHAFLPSWTLTKNVSTFLIIIAKVRTLPTFLCRKFLSNVFGLSGMAVWMKVTGFLSLRENVFPLKRRHRWVRPTSKRAVLCYGSNDTFTDSLAQKKCLHFDFGCHFYKIKAHSVILRTFSQILPKFPHISPGFSLNQKFWGCGCTPCTPASYTSAL